MYISRDFNHSQSWLVYFFVLPTILCEKKGTDRRGDGRAEDGNWYMDIEDEKVQRPRRSKRPGWDRNPPPVTGPWTHQASALPVIKISIRLKSAGKPKQFGCGTPGKAPWFSWFPADFIWPVPLECPVVLCHLSGTGRESERERLLVTS